MKKYLIFVLACLTAVPSFAQKLPKAPKVKGLARIMKQQARTVRQANALTQIPISTLALTNVRKVQGKVYFTPVPSIPQNNLLAERLLAQTLPPTDPFRLPLLLNDPSYTQRMEAIKQYKTVLENFKQFKSDINPFLYYQSKPSERRSLPPQEKAQLVNKILAMQLQLREVNILVAPQDQPLAQANAYVRYAMEEVDPTFVGMLDSGMREKRTDRKFDPKEFIMESPKAGRLASLKNYLPYSLRLRQAAAKLPAGLKVAVLNDDAKSLAAIKEKHQTVLFPKWKITTYQNTEVLLNDILGGRAQYDLILTDLWVPGGGGYYLTAKLRHQGFKGAIIAATAYQPTDSLSIGLFNKGFDGMIPLPGNFEFQKEWPLELMTSLNNYFYYRNLHGWNR